MTSEPVAVLDSSNERIRHEASIILSANADSDGFRRAERCDGGAGLVLLAEPPSALHHRGYLDSAPKGATVVDRVQIFAPDCPKHWLLVTSYRAHGEIPLDRYLSWPLLHTYALSGKREEVSRLLDAPAGSDIRGTFLVYTQSYPLLVISELDRPP
jgi:hypothetical protein